MTRKTMIPTLILAVALPVAAWSASDDPKPTREPKREKVHRVQRPVRPGVFIVALPFKVVGGVVGGTLFGVGHVIEGVTNGTSRIVDGTLAGTGQIVKGSVEGALGPLKGLGWAFGMHRGACGPAKSCCVEKGGACGMHKACGPRCELRGHRFDRGEGRMYGHREGQVYGDRPYRREWRRFGDCARRDECRMFGHRPFGYEHRPARGPECRWRGEGLPRGEWHKGAMGPGGHGEGKCCQMHEGWRGEHRKPEMKGMHRRPEATERK